MEPEGYSPTLNIDFEHRPNPNLIKRLSLETSISAKQSELKNLQKKLSILNRELKKIT